MMTRWHVKFERLGSWWCRMQHASLRWPAHGEYECAVCFRRYRVPWSFGSASQEPH
jgi:hypothetical protein